MIVELFLAVPSGCLRFVIVVFPDHTHLLFFLRYIFYGEQSYIIYVQSLKRGQFALENARQDQDTVAHDRKSLKRGGRSISFDCISNV